MENNCTHYWMLEQPNGPLAKGVCKKCGTEEEFPNAFTPKRTFRITYRSKKASLIEDINLGKTH